MLRDRILTAVLAGPPVIAAALAGGLWTIAGVLVLFGVAIIEYKQLLARRGYNIPSGLLLIATLLFCIDQAYFAQQLQGLLIMLFITLMMVWMLFIEQAGGERSFSTLAFSLLGLFYLSWSGAHFVAIRLLPEGAFWLIASLVTVWGADIGAYAGGSLMGKHLLLPSISPKKTWEGYLWGILGAILFATLLTLAGQTWNGGQSIQFHYTIPLSILIGLLSPAGDLMFSAVKRFVDAKDASNILPGHGGILDRIDSIFVSGLVTYYFLGVVTFGVLP